MLALIGMLGGIKNFLMTYWKVVIPVLIVAGTVISFHHVEKQRDDAVKLLKDYKEAQVIVEAKDRAENLEKEASAQAAVDAAISKATEQKVQLQLDNVKSTKAIKDLYETKIATIKHNLDWHSGLVLPPATGSSGGEGDTSGNSESSTEDGGECDRTLASLQGDYRTLEKACQIETVDYNTARAWIDAACMTVQCVDNVSKP